MFNFDGKMSCCSCAVIFYWSSQNFFITTAFTDIYSAFYSRVFVMARGVFRPVSVKIRVLTLQATTIKKKKKNVYN